MITEHDLMEAIAECQGERNPNANTCIKLAAFYTIKNELFGAEPERPTYSYAAPPEPTEHTIIEYASGTEFSDAVNGREPADVLPIIDELVSAVQALMPRLYDSFMRKLQA